MSLLKIAWRSVQHRSLSSFLTGLSMALGVALVVTVLVILNTVDDTFRRNAEGFHLILGAKGGKLDLVLNTVYHLSKPVGNVPYDFYLEFAQQADGFDADELFKRLDANNDGVISALTEVKPLVKLLCDRADRSPDGWISEKQLQAVAGRAPYASMKIDAAGLFAALDSEHKGRINAATPYAPHLRDKLGRLADPSDQIDNFLEDADQKPYGVLTRDEVAQALRREPYVRSKLSAARVLESMKADSQGNYRKPDTLPKEVGEALVAAQFSYLLSRADQEPDGLITRDELAYALRSPGRFGKGVEAAIPLCLGDSYTHQNHRYRVVGTVPQMFEVEYAQGRNYEFAAGHNFPADFRRTEHFFEAVIGSVVAHQTGLKVGDQFQPTHGISTEDGGPKHDAFTVVGILKPTGTPNDRAMFVNIEGFYVLDNHAKDGRKRIQVDAQGNVHVEPLPLEQREVTAVLLRMRDGPGYNADLSAANLSETINKGNSDKIQTGEEFDFSQVAQAVYPTQVVFTLFSGIVGNLQLILLILAVLIVVVAGIGILVAIYNSMSERVRDIAVMRALGAGRFTVMMVVLLESSLLACLGGLCGFFLSHGLIGWVLSPLFIEPQTGVSIRFTQFVQYELLLIPGLILLSALAGFLPALAAYRTDVGKALSAAP